MKGYLSNSEFEVFLRDMNTSLSQSVHTSFCTHTLKEKQKIYQNRSQKISIYTVLFFSYSLHLLLTLTSAPEAPGIISAIFFKLMPLVRFIFRE